MSFPNIPILYEDISFLAVNKPPNFVVNRSKTYSHTTLQDWIETQAWFKQTMQNIDEYKDLSYAYGHPIDIFKQRSGFVHRLDKDTSGVLLIAKNPKTLIQILPQFKQRTVDKLYTVLVHGKVQPSRGEINLPIGRKRSNRLQFSVRATGKKSKTLYTRVAYYPNLRVDRILKLRKQKTLSQTKKQIQGVSKNFKRAVKIYQGFSLLTIQIKTGRTHQIRVHMKHIQHPVVGDSTYAGRKRVALDTVWCPRQFLHASRLCIDHPKTKKRLCINAPLSKDLQKVKELLRE